MPRLVLQVPLRAEEIVLALICQNVKIVMDAYVLGTLFHYLVKKDPEIEMKRQLMAAMNLYCQERRLPAQLQDKIESYFKFQQQHSTTVSDRVMTVRFLSSFNAHMCVFHVCTRFQVKY